MIVVFLFLVVQAMSHLLNLCSICSGAPSALACLLPWCSYKKENEKIGDIYQEFNAAYLEAIYLKAREERDCFKK